VRLLVIDDDVELCSLLKEYLQREDYNVKCVHDGRHGLEEALKGGYDLIILDVMLPALDGFEILKKVREVGRIPVLMLTARDEDIDRILGLELGADDYLGKPFNPRELLARIKAILRRSEGTVNRGSIEVGGVVLDPATRTVHTGGQLVEVTTLEFDILEQLLRSAGREVSRDALMESLYGRKATPFDRSIDMHVSHLRKKIAGNRIKTIRGVGYQFVKSSDDGAPP
jgi:two-component system, OmpR family, response regulator CpxR